MMLRLNIFLALWSLVGSVWATAADWGAVRFYNEATDTTAINDMLISVYAMRLDNPGDRVAEIAQRFIGVPYVAHTLEGEPEMLTVNVEQLDCTTFVETVMAMAYTLGEKRTSWRDFVYNLERIRYRGGELKGYPSRLHYICDWAVDNAHKGVLTDATTRFPKNGYVVKTIDFMSANADKYPALADSANLAGIKQVEVGYRSHRFPYIKAADLADKAVKQAFRSGDIIAFTSQLKNLDVTHMGIVLVKNGEPYCIHASSSGKQVEVTSMPLADFLRRNRSFTGVRVFRLND